MRKLLIVLLILSISTIAFCGVDFNAASGVINVGSPTVQDDVNTQTIACWVFLRSSGEGGVGRIMMKGNATTDAGEWRFNFNATNCLSYTKDYDTTDMVVQSSNGTFVPGVWHHIVMTRTDSSLATDVKFYVDGVETTYKTQTNGSTNQVSDASLNLYIGNQGNDGATFGGTITEMARWNVVLTTSEIRKLYQMQFKTGVGFGGVRGLPLQIRPVSLIGYWPMDDYGENVGIGASSLIKDRSKFNNSGTTSGPIQGKAEKILSYQ